MHCETASPSSGNKGRPEQVAEVHGCVCLALIASEDYTLGSLLR